LDHHQRVQVNSHPCGSVKIAFRLYVLSRKLRHGFPWNLTLERFSEILSCRQKFPMDRNILTATLYDQREPLRDKHPHHRPACLRNRITLESSTVAKERG